MGATWVLVHLDFELVTQQVKDVFDIKDEKLQKYYEAMERMKEHFVEVGLKQVLRGDNSRVDELARLANSLEEWTAREVMMQVELLPQVELEPDLEEADWRTEFFMYFREGRLPSDPMWVRQVRRRAA